MVDKLFHRSAAQKKCGTPILHIFVGMGQLAQFFHEGILNKNSSLALDEATARHIGQVLRMQAGEKIQLTDGNGTSAIASITVAEKKRCTVRIEEATFHKQAGAKLHLCVGFTKNTSRNEWLLEKATELGVTSIVPLITKRTEREKTKHERWRSILISAMLQSQQYYLPALAAATTLDDVIKKYKGAQQKIVAHCIAELPRKPLAELLKPEQETIILIGPEGDLTMDEVNLCVANGYAGVSLGTQRLRTETAAMSVCAYFNLVNDGKE